MSNRPSYGELADALWNLRKAAGMSAARAADLVAGRQQPWLARFERGAAVPTPVEVEALTELYGAPAKVRRRLVALSRDLRHDPNPPARMVMQRAGEMQQRIGRIEKASRRIATFAPTVLPGLLQTEAYMRVVFASGNDLSSAQQAKASAGRLERAELLHQPGREFVFSITEGALRWQLGGAAVMAEQLDHLIEVSRLPMVRLGVIPWTTPVDVAPMHGFDLHDRRAAIVGTETATAFLTNRHDVAAYVKLLADLERLTTWGEAARTVLAEHARAHRQV